MLNFSIFSDTLVLAWLFPCLLMTLIWLKTPIFVSARGKKILLRLKLAILILLVLAMLDIRKQTKVIQDSASLIFAVDVSKSVDQEEKLAAFNAISKMCASLPQHVKPQIVAFDGTFSILTDEQSQIVLSSDEDKIKQFLLTIERDNDTDLGKALKETVKLIPYGRHGQIILFSDGQDTLGKANNILSEISELRIPISTVALKCKKPTTIPQITRFVLPEQVYIGEEVQAKVQVFHRDGGTIQLELLGSDKTNLSQKINTQPGMNAASFTFSPSSIGEIIYSVKASNLQNNKESSVFYGKIYVKPLPKVLVFENNPEEGSFFRELLTAENIEFQTASPGSLGATFTNEIKKYPCIVFNNIHKSAFSNEQLSAIKSTVKDGTGILMLGGNNSFGLGEYTDTPIEEIMPVSMPRRALNEPLVLLLVLDNSGSMAGEPWHYLVKSAQEILKLAVGHYVGVIFFNHEPFWAIPLQKIDDPIPLCQELEKFEPGGGTVFSLALANALAVLRRVPLSRKSVVFMSDGEPMDFHFVIPLFEEYRNSGVPITTIAAGEHADPECLKIIANETGGLFYESLYFGDLPEVFKREFKRISAPPFIEENIKVYLVDKQNVIKGISQEEIPSLAGINLTQLKNGATLILADQKNCPILAMWRLGLGKTAAFTSDLLPRWTTPWVKWNGFGKLFRQIIKELSEGYREKIIVMSNQKGTQITITADINTENEKNTNIKSVKISNTVGHNQFVTLNETVEGRYEAVFIASQPGIYSCRFIGSTGQQIGSSVIVVNTSSELLPTKPNLAFLQLIADKTGGAFFEMIESACFIPFTASSETVIYLSLWPFFAIAALLLYLLDIFLRRINYFGISDQSQLQDKNIESTSEVYLQLAQKFSNLAEEHSLKGEIELAKQFYLRAKAFYLKAQATKEANLMWERYKRFEGR